MIIDYCGISEILSLSVLWNTPPPLVEISRMLEEGRLMAVSFRKGEGFPRLYEE
jgi:hypothetical protein